MTTIIFLLSRKKNKYTQYLHEYFNLKNIKSFIAYQSYRIPEDFYGMNHIKNGPIAWETAFYYISTMKIKYNYIYFIEDDVYAKSPDIFVDCIRYYDKSHEHLIASDIYERKQHSDWIWWSDKEVNHFSLPTRSYNPFCRLSVDLVNSIFNYRLKYKKFAFHEIMFASLAKEQAMEVLDYRITKNPYIGDIRWKPPYIISQIDNKIYHPVKEHLCKNHG